MSYKHGKTKAQQVEFVRLAAYVKRMHVHRIHGDYTSHEHVNNMLNMYLILNPNPTMEGVKAIQWHDAGEQGPGDIPSPAKPCFGLGHVINKVERCVRENFGLEVENLSAEDILWMKGLDVVEFYLFCQDQMNMGNNFIVPKAVKVQAHLDNLVNTALMPPELSDYYVEIRDSREFIDDDIILEMRE